MRGMSSEATSVTVSKWQHLFRSDTNIFFTAAATMYQFARRLTPLMEKSPQFSAIAEMQVQAYLVAMNALSLLDPKNSWITLPNPPEASLSVFLFFFFPGLLPEFLLNLQINKRRLSKHVPAEKYQLDARDVEVVNLQDLQREYTLVNSRLDLMKRHSDLNATTCVYFFFHPEVLRAPC